MAEGASNCLCCGAPWPPINDEYVDIDRLGNRSLLWLQKFFVTDPHMVQRFQKPTLYSRMDESHMLHESHHRWALQVMAHDRPGDDDMHRGGAGAVGRAFPFTRKPKGRRPQHLFATWDAPAAADRLDHTGLYEVLCASPAPAGVADDYDYEISCCRACNMVMTQEFYFRYHLYHSMDKNPHRLIPNGVITLYDAQHTAGGLQDHANWTISAAPHGNRYPENVYSDDRDIMGAAVGYYLHMCLPVPAVPPDARFTDAHRAFYLHMCWVILQTTCLVTEYNHGNGNKRHGKLTQCSKSHLGAIELYLSYFCFRILSFQTPALAPISFEAWHQLYFWFANGCRALFPDDAPPPVLWAYAVFPEGGRGMSSRELVQAVSRLMVDQIERLSPLRNLLTGVPGGVTRSIRQYFLPRRHVEGVLRALRRGMQSDFDSYLEQVGVDCMFQRVYDLCIDVEEGIRKEMRSFMTTWHSYEIDNILRHTGHRRQDRDVAKMIYHACKLLAPPQELPTSPQVFAPLLATMPKRSPWAYLPDMRRLRAFDFSKRVVDR